MDDFSARFALLQKDFVEGLPKRMKEIEAAWNALTEQYSGEDAYELHRKVHSLKGAGATFGLPEVSAAAAEAEQMLIIIKDHGGIHDLAQWQHVLNFFRKSIDISTPSNHVMKEAETFASEIHPQQVDMLHISRVLFLIKDGTLREHFAGRISAFGFETCVVDSFEAALSAATSFRPAVFVTDAHDEMERLSPLRSSLPFPFSALMLGEDADFSLRLRSVRAGYDAFMPLPAQSNDLADRIEQLAESLAGAKYRIIVVEDDPRMGEFYISVLESAGMQVRWAKTPSELLPMLIVFTPDLVLMDMYMPECSGTELAQVIRQMNEFVTIPIVYLSSEADLEKQLAAMSIGGDDFLTKPVSPMHLVQAVTNRMRRWRTLRSLLVKDSLTGLLNHTNLMESLVAEVERSRRSDSVVSFAMIDLDKFKSVNDIYGHQTGDKVLRTLSNLLRQMLRKSDTIGRYGGEEFGVVLPGAMPEDALKIMEKVRKSFAAIRHHSDGVEFSVTLSCGIATYPGCGDQVSITEAADKALYLAKQNGRNRVELGSCPL